MIWISILLFVLLYNIATNDCLTKLFFLFIYTVVCGFQYDVGKDYFVYYEMVSQSVYLDAVYNKGEYLFYLIVKIAQYFDDPKILFILTSFIFFSVFILILSKLSINFKVPFIFLIFIFITSTNMVHNHMNGLRQYLAIAFSLLSFINIINKNYLFFIVNIFLSTLFHTLGCISLIYLTIPLISRYNNYIHKNIALTIFIVTPALYIIFSQYITNIVNVIFPFYSHYLTIEYGKGLSLSSLFTKFYYIPLYLIAIFYIHVLKGYKYLIILSIVFFWFIVFYLSFGFMYRVSSFFSLFITIPAIVLYLKFKNNISLLIFLHLYLLFPYVLKTLLFPQGVFKYQSVLF